MSISKRKIKYYNIDFTLYQNGKEVQQDPKKIIETFLNNYKNANDIDKKMDIYNNRFCLLDENSINYDKTYLSGFFISAKTQHRPPLIDETTLQKRNNPKNLTEGEEERTHFVMKIDKSTKEIILLLESRNVGVTAKVIAKYIKKALNDQNIEYKYGIIARDNFIDELQNTNKIKACDIFVEKDILGSDALNFSSPSENMQEEMILTVKAKRSKSIKEATLEVARSFISGTENRIKKIKVFGINRDNNPVILNTAMAQLDNYINITLDDETRIVNSKDMLQRMKEMLEEF